MPTRILTRKPWRAPTGPFQRYDRAVHRRPSAYVACQIANLIGWLRYAHDCQNPNIGCSCTGSHRHPHPT